MPLPPFLLSLVYTDQPPALWTAILLTIYCGGALLGQGLRRNDSKRLGVYLAVLVPLLTAFTLLIVAFSPESEFTPIPFEERQQMLGSRAEAFGDMMLSIFHKIPKEYDLRDQGSRVSDDSKAFSVRSESSGTYLLRMHSYGRYEDGIWKAVEDYEGSWNSMESLGARGSGQTAVVSVSDAFAAERYVPYAFMHSDAIQVDESCIRSAGKTAYSWRVYTAIDVTPQKIVQTEHEYLAFATEQYTMPDSEEKNTLLSIARAAGITGRGNAYQVAREVAGYVKNSGTYTMTPGKTPDGRDFVEYFLTESHAGYCVHFASATAALLQALDIPARYTIGYRATVPMPDTWTTVTENSAHAWVEVYLAGVGWIPIESTAGFSYDLQTAQTQPGSTGNTTMTAAPTPVPTPVLPDRAETAEPTAAPTETAPDDLPDAPRTPKPISTEQASPTEPPSMIGNGDGSVRDGKTGSKGGGWLLLLLVPVAAGVWYAVGMLIRNRRETSFRQKNPRKAVLAMLRYLKRLERFGIERDPQTEEWTEEAAFSDHPMTETRKLLIGRIRKAQKTLYRNQPLKRFFVKWILIAI